LPFSYYQTIQSTSISITNKLHADITVNISERWCAKKEESFLIVEEIVNINQND